jgi:hypothetical protein
MKAMKAKAIKPPTTPPTIAPTWVTFEPDDCRGVCEVATGLAAAVEVEREAEEVKGRLGMEARLENEGV